VLVPAVPLLAGAGVLIAGNPTGVGFLVMGAYAAPVPWFIGLVWSLTAVRRYVAAPAQPSRSASPAAAPPQWSMDAEEKRRQRRARGY
jgi:hypothetical protein